MWGRGLQVPLRLGDPAPALCLLWSAPAPSVGGGSRRDRAGVWCGGAPTLGYDGDPAPPVHMCVWLRAVRCLVSSSVALRLPLGVVALKGRGERRVKVKRRCVGEVMGRSVRARPDNRLPLPHPLPLSLPAQPPPSHPPAPASLLSRSPGSRLSRDGGTQRLRGPRGVPVRSLAFVERSSHGAVSSCLSCLHALALPPLRTLTWSLGSRWVTGIRWKKKKGQV